MTEGAFGQFRGELGDLAVGGGTHRRWLPAVGMERLFTRQRHPAVVVDAERRSPEMYHQRVCLFTDFVTARVIVPQCLPALRLLLNRK